MANLGFIGLGTMGGPMVKRLLDAGHDVTGYNRTRSRGDWLAELGMTQADTPRAVAEASDVFFSMLISSLVSGGRMGRSACGSRMYMRMAGRRMPIDLAA